MELANCIRPHPHGIQPMGNAWGRPADHLARHTSLNLGPFHKLFDADLLEILPKIASAYALLPCIQNGHSNGGEARRRLSGAVCLAKLAQLSSAFNIVLRQDSIWKELFLSTSSLWSPWRRRARIDRWLGSWRDTLIAQFELGGDSRLIEKCLLEPRRMQRKALGLQPRLSDSFRYYSDALYHPFHMASLPIETYFAYLQEDAGVEPPAKRAKSNSKLLQRRKAHTPLPRVSAKGTSLEEFYRSHCSRNFPAIIDSAGTEGWPCRTWSLEELFRRFSTPRPAGSPGVQPKERFFAAEGFECTLSVYRQYARSSEAFDAAERAGSLPNGSAESDESWHDPLAVADESPMYLFDSTFADDEVASKEWRVPELLRTVPPSFPAEQEERRETKADLFRLFGDKRPDYRWIIAGPRRSGSGWHKDPNMTSAWNAIMTGSKLWLMLPPDTCPPGVYVSPDEAEVTAPLSIAEWVHDYYDETKKRHGPASIGGDGKLLEGVCRAGETVYVPSGWWHLVVNLEGECAISALHLSKRISTHTSGPRQSVSL